MSAQRIPSIRAVLWDLGGVILRTFDSEGRRIWEQRLGLPRNGLARLVFEGDAGRKASIGKASTEDVWAWVLGQLNLPEENKGALVSDFWRGDRIDDALVGYIRSLRARVKTALITNAWPGTRQALEQEWGIADAFDQVVISSEVGTTKPGRRIYELALDRLAVRPEEALLVDDFVENITGAESAGMHTVLFRSPEQAMADVGHLLDGIETPRPGAERAVDPS